MGRTAESLVSADAAVVDAYERGEVTALYAIYCFLRLSDPRKALPGLDCKDAGSGAQPEPAPGSNRAGRGYPLIAHAPPGVLKPLQRAMHKFH